MSLYAYVENGAVTKVQSNLPLSTDRISNFYLLPDAERNTYGWYTIQEDSPTLDAVTQYLGVPTYAFSNGIVQQTTPVLNKTVDAVKREMIDKGQSVAERNIQSSYSLQEQIAALAGLTTAAHKTAVTNKINNVFIAFMNFRTDVNNCTTLAELKAVWDAHPEIH